MTNNAKYTSLKTIIAKAYRDMGLGEIIDISDAVEWAGEAMEFIGSSYSWIDKREILHIIEGKAKLPCDLHRLNMITCHVTEDDLGDCFMEEKSDEHVHWFPMMYSTDLYHKKHRYCESIHKHTSCDYTYILNDDYVFTNFDDGYVNLSYKGILTDENGWPMIPDDIKFKSAVAYHIMMKLAFIKLIAGTISESIYAKLAQERDWYIAAAQTRGHMPSIDQLEGIKNNIIRLIPKINQHSDAFKTANHQEQRNILSSRHNRTH